MTKPLAKADTKRIGSVKVKSGTTVPVFTRITIADEKLMSQLAKRRGTTRSVIIRQLIESMLDRERRAQRAVDQQKVSDGKPLR